MRENCRVLLIENLTFLLVRSEMQWDEEGGKGEEMSRDRNGRCMPKCTFTRRLWWSPSSSRRQMIRLRNNRHSELNPSIVCQTPLQSFPPASLLSLPLGIDWTLANALPRVPIAIGLLETLPRDRSTCIGYRGPQERGHRRACRHGRRREGKGNLYAAIDRHGAEPLPLHPRAVAATALKF